jgi:hypothetical protein
MKRLNTIAVVSTIAVAFAAASPLLAQDRIRPGQYEITTTKNGRTTVVPHCFTAADAKSSNGDAQSLKERIEKSAAARKCTTTDFKLVGDVVSFTTTCSGVSVSSTTTYHADSFETVMTTKSATGVTTTRVKARRLGDCP